MNKVVNINQGKCSFVDPKAQQSYGIKHTTNSHSRFRFIFFNIQFIRYTREIGQHSFTKLKLKQKPSVHKT